MRSACQLPSDKLATTSAVPRVTVRRDRSSAGTVRFQAEAKASASRRPEVPSCAAQTRTDCKYDRAQQVASRSLIMPLVIGHRQPAFNRLRNERKCDARENDTENYRIRPWSSKVGAARAQPRAWLLSQARFGPRVKIAKSQVTSAAPALRAAISVVRDGRRIVAKASAASMRLTAKTLATTSMTPKPWSVAR